MASFHTYQESVQREHQQIGQRAILNYIQDLAHHDPHKVAVHQIVAASEDFPGPAKQIVLSYRDLVTLVDKICWTLHEQGIRPNEFSLAYLGTSDLRHLLIALATNKLGSAALLLSPRGHSDVHEHLLGQCNISMLLYDRGSSNVATELSMKIRIQAFQVDDLLDLLSDLSPVKPYPYDQSWKSLASTPMVIIHTTGSTGMPKPVPIRHAALAAIDAQRLISQKDPYGIKCHMEILGEARTAYTAFPLFHVAGFELTCHLLLSGCTVLFGYPHQPPNVSIVRDALHVTRLDGALLPPSIIEDIAQDADLLAKISGLQWILTGGGSINYKAGNMVVGKTRIFNSLGSTECGCFIQCPTDPSHWNYYNFHPWTGICWSPIDSEQGSGEFELVVHRDSRFQLYQGVFHNFPDLDEWRTKDVFRRHPSIQNLWEYRYRIDDLVVFSTGEKMNPVPIESQVGAIPGVVAAIVVGDKQPYPGLLVEIEDSSREQHPNGPILADIKMSINQAIYTMNLKGTRDAQINPAALLIASPDRPFIRTPKGTIHRLKTLELYHTEIERFYNSAESSPSADYGDLHLDLSCENLLSRDIVSLIGNMMADTAQLKDDDDIFAAGLDSKHAQVLASVLSTAIGTATGQVDIVHVETTYRNPCARKLARYIREELRSPKNSSQTQAQRFNEVLSRHARNIPSTPSPWRIIEPANRDKHVLLTGTTGFVGSYTLQALLHRTEVTRITCLNRKTGEYAGKNPQQFFRNGVHAQYLAADLAEPQLGLSNDVYRNLLASVTDILHCQWAVDFNRPLEHFEPNIQGVENLIQFSHNSRKAAHIIFLSSVATTKGWDQSMHVPEKKLSSPSYAQTGYGESKLIAILLLDRASEAAGIRTSICRLGQVAGPLKTSPENAIASAWPERDWFPTLLRSAVELNCLPATLGAGDVIDWIPVDIVAELLCDLICLDPKHNRNHSLLEASYYHLVNPSRVRYCDLIPFLVERLLGPEESHVVSLKHWVNRLQKTPGTGTKLLGFFQGLASGDEAESVILSTEKTQSALPRLARLEAVREEWLGIWLDQWGFARKGD